MKNHKWIVTGLLVLFCAGATAQLRVASMISDGMVLQRNKRLPVWGWTASSQGVEVMFMEKRYYAVAGADGKWTVTLDPCPAGGPYEMSILAGKDTIYIRNVLVGEVWLCAGQSNMVLDFNNEGVRTLYAADLAASANDQIRQLLVGRNYSATPAVNFQTSGWKAASPRSLPAFSAAAYFFARTLYEKYHVPIGIINASLGGTVAEAWTSEEGLRGLPVVTEKVEPKNMPSVLYNAMIAPLVPYTIRGVAWYQGEYNTHKAFAYRKLFPALINDWRNKWGEAELPFIYQQLPNFQTAVRTPSDNEWAELREAQLLTLGTTPYTAMSVAIDIGGANELHPADKKDIGFRLALAAERLAYREKKVVSSGPLYRGMRVEGNKIVVSFDLFGSRLAAKGGDSLAYFAIAGADRKFVWARAVIRGATVEVSASQVEHPVAVRYAWAGNPEGCNLYNKEGLPASPFRTDDWPGLTVGN